MLSDAIARVAYKQRYSRHHTFAEIFSTIVKEFQIADLSTADGVNLVRLASVYEVRVSWKTFTEQLHTGRSSMQLKMRLKTLTNQFRTSQGSIRSSSVIAESRLRRSQTPRWFIIYVKIQSAKEEG